MNVLPRAPEPHPVDLRWAALAEAETLGDALRPDELAFLRAHMPIDPALRAQQALRTALPGWGEAPLPDEDDETVLSTAVDAYLRGEREPGRTRGVWLAGGLAAAAAVVLAVLAWPGLGLRSEADGSGEVARGPVPVITGSAATADEPVPPRAADDGGLRSLSGTWVHEDGTPLTGAPTPGAMLTARTRACLGDAASGRLCGEPGTRVRAVEAERPAVEWLEGSGELTTPGMPGTPGAVALELRVAGVRLSGADATVAVERTVDGRWSVHVREGSVELQTPEGTRSLVAGDRFGPDPERDLAVDAAAEPSGARAAVPDAATLLQRARIARAEGAMADAASHYRRLLRSYPRSSLAGPAWVALGQVELSRGRTRAALEAFDRYLQRGGPLAEEAAYGRIEALRTLGRTDDERAATERFLAKYPGSSYAGRLRRR